MDRIIRLLIVEDSELDVKLLSMELQKHHISFDPRVIATHNEFDHALSEQLPDAIICDYYLNDFTALDALDSIRSRHLRVPFIVVSNKIDDETAVAAMKAGADDYIMKSNLQRLVPALERELRIAEAERQNLAQEAALAESEERFRILFEMAPDTYYLMDDQGRFVAGNKASEELTGYRRDELQGRSVFECGLLSPECVIRARRSLTLAITEDYSTPREYTLVRKDGGSVEIEIRSRRIVMEGRPLILGVARDITDRKRSEEKLQHQVAAMQTANDGMAILDAHGMFVYMNDAHAAIYGFKRPEELIGASWEGLYGPTELTRFHEVIMPEFWRKGKWIGQAVGRKQDGSEFPQEISLSKLDDGGIVCVVRDMTEQKKIETDLRENERLFRDLFTTSPDAIILFDPHSVKVPWAIIDCNDIACSMNGYRREEMIGASIDSLLPTPLTHEQREQHIAKLRKHGIVRFETLHRRKDGRVLPIDVSSSIVLFRGQELILGIDRDISERRDFEESLKRSEANLSTAVSMAKLGYWEYDVEEDLFTFNDHFYSMLRTTAEKAGGYTMSAPEFFRRYVHPDDVPIILREVQRSMTSSDPNFTCHLEHRALMGDGTIGHVAVNAFIVKDDAGRTVKTYGVNQDITDRKEIEQKLTNEQSLLNALMETIPDHVYFKDLESRFLRISRSQALRYGFPDPVQTIGKTDSEFFSAEHAQRAMEDEQEIIRTGTAKVAMKEKETWPDGSVTWVSTTKMPLRDPSGNIIGTFGISREITEQKKWEDQLESSERRFRVLFDHAPDAYYLTDLSGRFVDGNKAAERISGYSKEELIGKSIFDVSLLTRSEKARAARIIAQTKAGQRTDPVEFLISRKGGGTVVVEIHTRLVELNGESLVLNVARDISDRKIAEQTLRLQSSALESADNGISIVSVDGTIQWVNPAFTRLTGFRFEEAVGQNHRMLRSGVQDQKFYRRLWDTILAGNVWFGEIVNRRKDGTLYHEEMTITPVLDEKGKVKNFVAVKQDITNRKKAEGILKRYELLSENTRDVMIFVQADDGRIIEANKAAERLYGYDRSEFTTLTIRDLRAPQTLRDLPQQMSDAYDKGIFIETLHRKKDGTIFPVEVSSKGAFIGNSRMLVSIIHDITKRKRTEEEIKRNRALLNSILEASRDGVVLVNSDQKIIFANPSFAQLFGYTSSNELLGEEISVVQAREERERLKAYRTKRLQGQDVPSLYEFKGLRKDGALVELEANVTLTEIDGEKIILGVLRNIDERKKIEEQILLLASALRSITQAITITDLNNVLTFVNDAAVKMYGYSEEELVGKNISMVSAPEKTDAASEKILRATLNGGWNGEVLNKKRDGTIFPVWLSTSAVRSDDGSPIALIGVATDLTETKRTAERQRTLESQLFQSQKMESLGTLAGGIAHDFNNILGIILGHATLIEHMKDDPEIRRSSIQTISKSVQRGAAIVKQILTFARRGEIETETIQVNQFVDDFVRMLRETFPRTIDIIVDHSSTRPIINVDQSQFHQALMNLCLNARDAMMTREDQAGGLGTLSIVTGKVPGDSVRALFAEASASDYVRVSVSDTGHGMEEHIREKIFEPFFTTKPVGKGTGLGLAVVYGVVRSHLGFVNVKSTPGAGSTFELYFPSASSYNINEQTSQPLESGSATGHGTILVVDDEESLVSILRQVLEASGYDVLTANDGVEAMNVFREHRGAIDLVLTDIGLPLLDGKALFSKMKSLQDDVKVILASGYLDPEYKTEMLKGGAIDFIQKPYLPDEVLKKIRTALSGPPMELQP